MAIIVRAKNSSGETEQLQFPEGTPEDVTKTAVEKHISSDKSGQVARQKHDVPIYEGIARSASQALTAGFGDEISSGIKAAGESAYNSLFGKTDDNKTFSQRYEEILERERARQQSFVDANHFVDIGVQTVASLLPVARVAQVAGKVLPSLFNVASATPAPLVGRALAGAGLGAAQGAVYGFGSGEGGVGDRAITAGVGGAIGGSLGVLAPIVGAATKAGSRALQERGQAKRLADALEGFESPNTTSIKGITPAAVNDLKVHLGIDALSGRGFRNLRASGPSGMVANASPEAQELLKKATQSSAPARELATGPIRAHVNQKITDITTLLDNTFGQSQGVTTTAKGIRKQTAVPRQDAYNIAYAQPIDYASDTGKELLSILENRVTPKILNKTNDMMRADGVSSLQILIKKNAKGKTIGMKKLPDVVQIDWITRALNDVAKKEAKKGAMGGQTNLGRIYENLSRDLRNSLKLSVPEYERALKTAATPIRAIEALKIGQNWKTVSTDDFKNLTEGMSTPERKHVAIGIREQIDETINNVKRSIKNDDLQINEAKKTLNELSDQASNDKITMIVGSNVTKSLQKSLEEVRKALNLSDAVSANFSGGLTGNRVNQNAQDTADIIANSVRINNPIPLAQRLGSALLGRTQNQRNQIAAENYKQIAKVLTSYRGKNAKKVLEEFKKLKNTPVKNAKLVQQLLQLNPALSSTILREFLQFSRNDQGNQQ